MVCLLLLAVWLVLVMWPGISGCARVAVLVLLGMKGSRCNTLGTIAPDVARYWNHSKNVKSPEQVSASSTFTAEWRCPACKYEWQTPIGRRVCVGSGCPKCSLASRVMHSHPTFAEADPAELAQWDHERNAAEGCHIWSPWEAASRCTGFAHAVQEGSHTAGEPRHTVVSAMAEVVQCVLTGKFVPATPWSLCFHLLQLSLMWKRPALHLLR
ncbi:hypothetical protein ABBQ32_003673 [Trebouxia sp. C0010 RCD-2024]